MYDIGTIGIDEPIQFSGPECDEDADWTNIRGVGTNNNSDNGFATNAASTAGNGLGNHWGSPGAGSSTSARGDSPIPINLGGTGPQIVVGVAVSTDGMDEIGMVDGGMGMEGETISGKRKR